MSTENDMNGDNAVGLSPDHKLELIKRNLQVCQRRVGIDSQFANY